MDFYFLKKKEIKKGDKIFYYVVVYEDKFETINKIWLNSDKFKMFDNLSKFDEINDFVTFRYDTDKKAYELAI